MFKLDKNFSESDLNKAISEVERNYVIQKNDFLDIQVYTHDGERIIDPENELGQKVSNKSNDQIDGSSTSSN